MRCPIKDMDKSTSKLVYKIQHELNIYDKVEIQKLIDKFNRSHLDIDNFIIYQKQLDFDDSEIFPLIERSRFSNVIKERTQITDQKIINKIIDDRVLYHMPDEEYYRICHRINYNHYFGGNSNL